MLQIHAIYLKCAFLHNEERAHALKFSSASWLENFPIYLSLIFSHSSFYVHILMNFIYKNSEIANSYSWHSDWIIINFKEHSFIELMCLIYFSTSPYKIDNYDRFPLKSINNKIVC